MKLISVWVVNTKLIILPKREENPVMKIDSKDWSLLFVLAYSWNFFSLRK